MSPTENREPGTENRFYITGGTLRPDAPCYVERQADLDLYDGLTRGEFCYVLTSRQMGKSSLMVRVADRLRREGASVVLLDLGGIGCNLSVEQWYAGLLHEMARQLRLEAELGRFWRDQRDLGPLQRWMTALREIVLGHCPGPVILFVDEIDAVLSLPFSTDEFFASIRQCYNRRAQDPVFDRLTFCLMGVAVPTDLIRDTRTTPFNIGRRVELTDFTEAEAAPLAAGFTPGSGPSAPPAPGSGPFAPRNGEGAGRRGRAALLRRVLYWTGGHPYLTQRLCQAVVPVMPAGRRRSRRPGHDAGETPALPASAAGRVDPLCEGLFLSPQAREQDTNLLFVRDRLLRGETDTAALLELYARVRQGRRVTDDETNPLVGVLRLAGIVRFARGGCRVRNRIYGRVFDGVWVREHMPDAERRRQRAAYRRGVLRAASVAASMLAVVGGLALTAVRQAQRADRNAAAALASAGTARRAQAEAETARDLARQEAGKARAAEGAARRERAEAETAHGEAVEQQRRAEARRAEAERERRGATLARTEATERLGQSYLSQARALRFSGRAGQRFDSLAVIAKAAKIRPSLALRSEAIAAMALPDVRLAPEWLPLPKELSVVGFDAGYRRWVWGDRRGNIQLRTVRGNRLLFSLPGAGEPLAWIGFFPQDEGPLLMMGRARPGSEVFQVWDVPRKRLLLSVPDAFMGRVAVSPDGRWLAIATGGEGESALEIYDRQSWERRHRIAPVGTPGTLAFHPDGRRLAVSRFDIPVIQVYDIASGSIAQTFTHPAGIWVFQWTPDGKLLVAGGMDHRIHLWDAATGEKRLALEGHQSTVTALSMLDGGRLLASTSWDETIRLWDPHAGKELLTWSGPPSGIGASPDGRLLGHFGGEGGRIRFIAPATGKECRTLYGASAPVEAPGAAAFSPDGGLLAVADATGDGVQLWEVRDGRRIATVPSGVTVVALFEAAGEGLITSGAAGLLRWRIQRDPVTGGVRVGAGKPLVTVESATGAGRFALSRDGRTLAVVDGERVRVLDPLAAERTVKPPPGRGRTDPLGVPTPPRPERVLQGQPGLWTIAISPDGRQVATGAYLHGEHRIRVWDLHRPTGRGRDLEREGYKRAHVAFSPDSRLLVTGLVPEYLLWSVGTWRSRGRIERQARGYFPGPAAFSPDGRLLAIARSVQTAQLLDPRTGREVATLEVPFPRRLGGFCFSPDGRYLAATAAGNRTFLWDLRLIRRRLRAMGLDWDDAAPQRFRPASRAP